MRIEKGASARDCEHPQQFILSTANKVIHFLLKLLRKGDNTNKEALYKC